MHKLEESGTPFSVGFSIVSYSLCSSTLLLANKMAMTYIPSPAAISLIQIVFTTVVVLLIRSVGYTIDGFETEKLKRYAPYVFLFVTAIYANMKALSCSNVETVIVFRACTPIAVCVIEYIWMQRSFPTNRSAIAMAVLALGATAYCLSEAGLSLDGACAYLWVSIYFVLITVEMTYGKLLTSTVKMESIWGPVLYCNALSIVPMYLLGLTEANFLSNLLGIAAVSSKGLCIIFFSCLAGTAIGYTGWECRCLVSATTYTVVGVVNKFLTLLLNVLVWDKHSSPSGLLAVCLCLGAGAFYQQAPRRDEAAHQQQVEEEMKALTDRDREEDVEG